MLKNPQNTGWHSEAQRQKGVMKYSQKELSWAYSSLFQESNQFPACEARSKTQMELQCQSYEEVMGWDLSEWLNL